MRVLDAERPLSGRIVQRHISDNDNKSHYGI
jgi:hypothetical protein